MKENPLISLQNGKAEMRITALFFINPSKYNKYMAQAPEIKSWSKVQLLESDIDERLEVWEIEGEDENDIEYTAIGEYYEDEPVVVKEIEPK